MTLGSLISLPQRDVSLSSGSVGVPRSRPPLSDRTGTEQMAAERSPQVLRSLSPRICHIHCVEENGLPVWSMPSGSMWMWVSSGVYPVRSPGQTTLGHHQRTGSDIHGHSRDSGHLPGYAYYATDQTWEVELRREDSHFLEFNAFKALDRSHLDVFPYTDFVVPEVRYD